MLTEILKKYRGTYQPVVRFNAGSDKLMLLDFTEANTAVTATIVENTELFSAYVDQERNTAGALYGIGGYDEHRTVYSRSRVFDAPDGEEPRRLHLGVDIWGTAGTEVFAPLDGVVHSFAFNDHYGDYGATIILQHQLDGFLFHTLFGHLSLEDLAGITEGKPIRAGEEIAHFGEPKENGHWPPHLHFQLVIDLESKQGDYPGVCQFSKRSQYLANCPDPDLILGMLAYARK